MILSLAFLPSLLPPPTCSSSPTPKLQSVTTCRKPMYTATCSVSTYTPHYRFHHAQRPVHLAYMLSLSSPSPSPSPSSNQRNPPQSPSFSSIVSSNDYMNNGSIYNSNGNNNNNNNGRHKLISNDDDDEFDDSENKGDSNSNNTPFISIPFLGQLIRFILQRILKLFFNVIQEALEGLEALFMWLFRDVPVVVFAAAISAFAAATAFKMKAAYVTLMAKQTCTQQTIPEANA